MARTVTAAGGNLFAIAARWLGDATQANRLATMNNLSDPFLVGVETIAVPDIDQTATGGLPFGPITISVAAPSTNYLGDPEGGMVADPDGGFVGGT